MVGADEVDEYVKLKLLDVTVPTAILTVYEPEVVQAGMKNPILVLVISTILTTFEQIVIYIFLASYGNPVPVKLL